MPDRMSEDMPDRMPERKTDEVCILLDGLYEKKCLHMLCFV